MFLIAFIKKKAYALFLNYYAYPFIIHRSYILFTSRRQTCRPPLRSGRPRKPFWSRRGPRSRRRPKQEV